MISNMLLSNGAPSSGAFIVCFQFIVASTVAASASPALMLIQAQARVQAVSNHTFDAAPPRMYVGEGCDGSTTSLAHAKRLMELHGLPVGKSYDEVLYPDLNMYYHEAGNDIIGAMKMMNEAIRKKGQTFVFKSILHRDMATTVSSGLRDMGTLAVYVTRRNILDQIVCMIRDCFFNVDVEGSVYGYPVTLDGKPDESNCFTRRDGATNKAMLKVGYESPRHELPHLKENIDTRQQLTYSGYTDLTKAGYKGAMIYIEDLTAFEIGGEQNIETSMKAWEALLQAWGVTMNEEVTRKYLQSYAYTWEPSSHKESVYNYDELVAELKSLGKLDWLRP